MGQNTFVDPDEVASGLSVRADHVSQYATALNGEIVPRTNGAPTTDKPNIGTSQFQWGTIFANALSIDGNNIDFDALASSSSRIISGRVSALAASEGLQDFIRCNGTSAQATILGADTNLELSIEGTSRTISTDILLTGLDLAPSLNNTCLVNGISGLSSGNNLGEDGVDIVIDNIGSEISNRDGQYVAFITPANEMFIGLLDGTSIKDVYRGFFLNSTAQPVQRGTLADNSTLTLLNLGWVFVGTAIGDETVVYKSPIYSPIEPTSPSDGDYWFDTINNQWKSYSLAETTFEVVNQILVGFVVLNTAGCIGSRSIDFSKTFSDENTITLEINNSTIVDTKASYNTVSVNGSRLLIEKRKISWDITTDLVAGETETTATLYHLYLDDNGVPRISNVKPYWREDLKGDYHPYHPWRMVGMVYNNNNGNFAQIWDHNKGDLVDQGDEVTMTISGNGVTAVQALTFLNRFPINMEVICTSREYRLSVTNGVRVGGRINAAYTGAFENNASQQSTFAVFYDGISTNSDPSARFGGVTFSRSQHAGYGLLVVAFDTMLFSGTQTVLTDFSSKVISLGRTTI